MKATSNKRQALSDMQIEPREGSDLATYDLQLVTN